MPSSYLSLDLHERIIPIDVNKSTFIYIDGYTFTLYYRAYKYIHTSIIYN